METRGTKESRETVETSGGVQYWRERAETVET